MLIIKGEQGLTKSSAFRAIADPFFTDNGVKVGEKDSLMAQQLAWIVESAELESMNKADTTAIKQYLSAQEDWYRPPYGAQLIKAPRHFVNVGTTNADTFLKDATGDRRFWPLEVQVVHVSVLREMVPQLLAEALHRLEQGEQYWPTREEEKALIFPEQEQFKRTDVWEDMLHEYVNAEESKRIGDPAARTREFFPTTELYTALNIKADRIDGAGNMDERIARAMKALGFVRHRETKGQRSCDIRRRALGRNLRGLGRAARFFRARVASRQRSRFFRAGCFCVVWLCAGFIGLFCALGGLCRGLGQVFGGCDGLAILHGRFEAIAKRDACHQHQAFVLRAAVCVVAGAAVALHDDQEVKLVRAAGGLREVLQGVVRAHLAQVENVGQRGGVFLAQAVDFAAQQVAVHVGGELVGHLPFDLRPGQVKQPVTPCLFVLGLGLLQRLGLFGFDQLFDLCRHFLGGLGLAFLQLGQRSGNFSGCAF